MNQEPSQLPAKIHVAQPPRRFDLLQFILNIRYDLRETQRFNLQEQQAAYLGWILQAGLGEYRALAENLDLIHELLQPYQANPYGLSPLQYLTWLQHEVFHNVFPLPQERDRFLIWFYARGLQKWFLWDLLSSGEKAPIEQLPLPQREAFMAEVRRVLPPPKPGLPFEFRPFGVNVVGYAFGQLGIGEDGRMAARALLAAGIPMAMLDFPPGDDIPKNDQSMADHVVDQAEYAFNFFCMTAEENGRFFAERGRQQFSGRYNIGYWPWELPYWPKDWEMLLDLVDEVWVSTRHTYEALQPVCTKPLRIMPMAVELGEIRHFANRQEARKHFGLPVTARLFCFAFDLNSYVDRKNPQACVEAFLQAFPQDQFSAAEVGLVIKAHKPKQYHPAWESLKKLASTDRRLHIMETTLPRPELLALYAACDCYLSLHRAEGFGRGMAEALQLGLHVICSGYSGNVDFCRPPHADLVRCRLVELRADQYPHATGQVWAEPDVGHAAELMRRFVATPAAARRQNDWPEFSVKEVGLRYRQRLQEIWLERRTMHQPAG